MEIIHLINSMAPYLLLGFLLAGILHAFVPARLYHRHLGRPNFKSVLYATLVAIPLPLCSCGVIPTAMSLRKEGASKGAVLSFLIATPQTGVDSILATYSLMGLPFAIIRPIAARPSSAASFPTVWKRNTRPMRKLLPHRLTPVSPSPQAGPEKWALPCAMRLSK